MKQSGALRTVALFEAGKGALVLLVGFGLLSLIHHDARRWAAWFAALSGAIYLPFEAFELYERVTWISAGALVLNSAVVVVMLSCLLETRREGNSEDVD